MTNANPKTTDPTTALPPDLGTVTGTQTPNNDNAACGGIPDTTWLVASADVVQYIRATLRRCGVVSQHLADAIAEVQVNSIEAARMGRMPADSTQWKALSARIASRWAIDHHRRIGMRDKVDAGLCGDADAYARPTLYWEHRDPVDTRRYLAAIENLFASRQMPEHAKEILWAEADEVPHAEIAADLGITQTVVDNRLCRIRKAFRARRTAIGLLAMLPLLLFLVVPPSPMSTGAPPSPPTSPAASVHSVPGSDAGAPRLSEKSSTPVRENRPIRD